MKKIRTVFDRSDHIETRVIDPELRSEEWKKLRQLYAQICGEAISPPGLQIVKTAAAGRRKFDEMVATFEKVLSSVEAQACAGNAEALEVLYRVAYQACAGLIEVCRHQETVARSFARKQFAWPMILWPNHQRQKMTLDAFKRLEIGTDLEGPLNHEAVIRDRCNFTPARGWVAALCWQIEDVRRRFSDPILRERLLQNKATLKVLIPKGWSILPQDAKRCVTLPELCSSPRSLEAWQVFALDIALRESGGSLRDHPVMGAAARKRADETPRAWKDADPKTKIKREKSWNTVADSVVESNIKNAMKSLARKGA